MIKILIALLLISQIYSIPNDLRLIEYNETHRKWLTEEEVLKTISECGKKGDHGGFFDVTDHPKLSADNQKHQIIKFPSSVQYVDLVNHLIQDLNPENLKATVEMLSKRHNRYYQAQTGVDAANDIKAYFEKVAAGKSGISVSLFKHSWLQPSVIARIEGNGANKHEVIVIGAHEDSINLRGATLNAPGADDDASGVSCVLEIFRSLVENGFAPSRTVEFHTYSAEEVGLRGSQDIASKYQRDQVKVVAMMQLDMTMYHGTQSKMGIVNDYVNTDLTRFLRILVNTYSSIGYVDTMCGYGCSDHASWTKAGYAACFPFESDFKDINSMIHTVNDLLGILDIQHALEFAKVGTGFVVELSK